MSLNLSALHLQCVDKHVLLIPGGIYSWYTCLGILNPRGLLQLQVPKAKPNLNQIKNSWLSDLRKDLHMIARRSLTSIWHGVQQVELDCILRCVQKKVLLMQ